MKSLQDLIENRLKESKTNKRQFAKSIGISAQRLSNWLARNSIPKEYIRQISVSLNISVYDLMNLSPEHPSHKKQINFQIDQDDTWYTDYLLIDAKTHKDKMMFLMNFYLENKKKRNYE